MLCARIAEQRKLLGLNQEELATKLNISQKSISKYENGARRPSYEVLIAMADIFGVSTDYLLGRDKFCVEYANSKEKEQKKPFNTNENERNLLEIYRNYKDNGFSDTVLNELKSFFPELNVNPIKSISERERTVLDVFRKLNEDNQDIIVGDMKKYLKEQRYEESVAADKQLKNLK